MPREPIHASEIDLAHPGHRASGGRSSRLVPRPREGVAPPSKAEAARAATAAASAWAAGRGRREPNPMEVQPALALWTVVVFVGLFLRPGPVRLEAALQALHQREEHLEHCLLQTEKARNESEQLLAEHRALMAQADERVRAMLDKAHKDAQAIGRRDRQAGPGRGRAARDRAQREIATARDQALAEIWGQTADDRRLGRRAGPLQGAQRGRASAAARPGHPGAARRAGSANGHGAEVPRMTASAAAAAEPTQQSIVAYDQVGARPALRRALVNAADERGPGRGGARRARRDRNRGLQGISEVRAIPGLDQVSPTEKDRILLEVFGERVSSLVLRFLRVLNRHGRLGLAHGRRPRGPADLGPPAQADPGPGPLGRPARSRARRSALRDQVASDDFGHPDSAGNDRSRR